MNRKTLLNVILYLQPFLMMAQSGNFSIQVGAFNTKVEEAYFSKLKDVAYYKDHNDIHRYYIPGLLSKADAESRAEEARKAGFKAVVIDNEEVAKSCKINCNTKSIPEPDIASLNWIYFDFDKADLRTASQAQLDKLVRVLNANPTYTATLSAHTDAKGSNEYNQALSERRARNAKDYTIAKGIADARIKTMTSGESTPIAKNDVSGKDTETGRQYNRRVEIRVYDAAGTQMNVVEAPNVPNSLKN